MSESKRATYTPQFKAKVALAALKGDKTVNELSQEHKVHPTQVALWKKELQDNAASLFDKKRGPEKVDEASQPEHLYAEIGKLQVELGWLQKKSGICR